MIVVDAVAVIHLVVAGDETKEGTQLRFESYRLALDVLDLPL